MSDATPPGPGWAVPRNPTTGPGSTTVHRNVAGYVSRSAQRVIVAHILPTWNVRGPPRKICGEGL